MTGRSGLASLLVLLAAAWTCGSGGCAGGQGARGGGLWGEQPGPPSWGYYPAHPGAVWAYDVRDPLARHALFTVARVVSVEGARATIENGGERFVRVYTPTGVQREQAGAYLLREPLQPGTRWSLASGGEARIVAVGQVEVTPAGRFGDCLVVEERLEEIRVRTVLAPGIGPLRIQVLAQERGAATPVLLNEAVLRIYQPEASLADQPD